MSEAVAQRPVSVSEQERKYLPRHRTALTYPRGPYGQLRWQAEGVMSIVTDPSELSASADPGLARRQLASADLVDDTAIGHRDRILELIAAQADIALPTCRPGHLTGSAFVVDPGRGAALVLFHTKLARWLQPGGHADGDTNLAAVALREATEETGIEGLQVAVPAIDVDIHRVDPPREDPHLHLDVRFLVLAPGGVEPVGNHESQGFRWLDQADFAGPEFDAGTRRMAAAGFARAAALDR